MKILPAFSAALAVSVSALLAADPPAPAATSPATPAAATPATPDPNKPHLKIIPGQVIVPTDAMRRIWGELISLDLTTRTGKFRKESTDEVIDFTVMPYAELLHHASFGDLQDFKIGTRAIFRLHENDKGEWVWLTYIQDEMNFLNGHKEYYYVDKIDPEKGELDCTDANFDKSYVRKNGIIIKTDKDTRYWKQGQQVKFSDIQIGEKLRTSTHGIGKGEVHVAWEVFLDEESLQKFQAEQKALEHDRLAKEGAPGYVDKVEGNQVDLTLFQEGGEQAHQLFEKDGKTVKQGTKIRVAAAGVDRKPNAAPTNGTVTAAKFVGNLCKVTVKLDAAPEGMKPGEIARLWQE